MIPWNVLPWEPGNGETLVLAHLSLEPQGLSEIYIYNTFWYSQQNGGGGGGAGRVSFWSLFDIIQNYINIHVLSVFEP